VHVVVPLWCVTIQNDGLGTQTCHRAQVLRDWCAGYAGVDFGQQEPELEILDLSGKVVRIGWSK